MSAGAPPQTPLRELTALLYYVNYAGGANSAPPDPLAALRGPTSKGRGGEGGEGIRWGGEGRGGEGREVGEKGRGRSSPQR